MGKKIVINRCFGGFGIKEEFLSKMGYSYDFDVPRDDPEFIKLLETYGSEAISDSLARLVIVEIPDGATDYRITDYDGLESVTAVVNGKIVDL